MDKTRRISKVLVNVRANRWTEPFMGLFAFEMTGCAFTFYHDCPFETASHDFIREGAADRSSGLFVE